MYHGVVWLGGGGGGRGIESDELIIQILDPIYTGLVTTVQVLYFLEIYVVLAEFS